MRFFSETDSDTGIINRFIETLRRQPHADPHRLVDAGSWVAVAIGGKPNYYHPIGNPPKSGTVLGELHAAGETVDEERWVELVRQRLMEIVDNGVDPVFLVRGLAHHITDIYRDMADTGRVDENRDRSREAMYAAAEDPVQLARYRRRLDDNLRSTQPGQMRRLPLAFDGWPTSCRP